MGARRDNRRTLIELLDNVFLTKTSDQWDRILAEGGYLSKFAGPTRVSCHNPGHRNS